jgi:diguanylate cyclase (GGDEF)-like protein
VDPCERQHFVELLRSSSKCRNLDVNFRRKNGEIFSGLVSASAMEVDGVPCIISVVRDTSEAKAAEKRIKNLAFYDPLTGLPNRRLLLDRLRQFPDASAGACRKVALLFVDLDNFKSLNDTLGFQAGDFLLQEVARRLTACVREYDTVARVGGDEFAVILENLNEHLEGAASQARIVGEKILAVLREPFEFAGHECHCPSSLGIDVFGSQPECTSEALQRAEIAMFHAKEAGRNTARFFSPAQQSAVNARAAMEERLRQGIKNNQFFLYYQPQIERGLLTGVEALIRWKHPARGFIMPDEFIPLAEQTGLILQLGELALETACSQLVAWASRQETSHLTLAVNISPRHLRQTDFVEQVMTIVNRTGARPENLRLELTESMLSHSIDDTVDKMRELRLHGVRFSLDDFGTGYSSLAYLKQLPISRLKIDRAFVKDILVDAASGAIAQTIISLGRALDLSVIAEGVETEEQRGFLAGMGCHSYQGYLFSRPLPVKEFERFLAEFSIKQSGYGRNPALPAGIPLEI